MAEYSEVMKQYKRMCNACVTCTECPVDEIKGFLTCLGALVDKPDEMEEVVMQWAKENPAKTNRDKFKEVFGLDFKTTFKASPWTLEWLDEEYKEPEDD